MAPAHVKVGREDVAEGEGARARARLQAQHLGRVAVHVCVAGGRPALRRHVEVVRLGRVRKDLVRELVGNLLDEQLRRDVGRAGNVGERHVLAKGQRGGRHGEGRLGRVLFADVVVLYKSFSPCLLLV